MKSIIWTCIYKQNIDDLYILCVMFIYLSTPFPLQPRTPTELSQPPLTNAQGLTPPRLRILEYLHNDGYASWVSFIYWINIKKTCRGINKFNQNILRVSKNAKRIYKNKNMECESFQKLLQYNIYISLNSGKSKWNTLLISLLFSFLWLSWIRKHLRKNMKFQQCLIALYPSLPVLNMNKPEGKLNYHPF